MGADALDCVDNRTLATESELSMVQLRTHPIEVLDLPTLSRAICLSRPTDRSAYRRKACPLACPLWEGGLLGLLPRWREMPLLNRCLSLSLRTGMSKAQTLPGMSSGPRTFFFWSLLAALANSPSVMPHSSHHSRAGCCSGSGHFPGQLGTACPLACPPEGHGARGL